jgi:Tfp pilus assembly pilus retraction ATPase PilT
MEAGRSDGMVTMDRALQDAFRANLVDKEEAMRFAKNPLMFK